MFAAGKGDVPKVILSFTRRALLCTMTGCGSGLLGVPQGLPALASGHSMMHILV